VASDPRPDGQRHRRRKDYPTPAEQVGPQKKEESEHSKRYDDGDGKLKGYCVPPQTPPGACDHL
jgi:hypothetical protein